MQQGIGDTSNPSQQWEFLPRIKPTHGLAAKVRGSFFNPKIFCFLPLTQDSKLPVHVNGNFILDSSSRSDFWQSRDSYGPDAKTQWNDRLIEAIGSSYAEFLVKCQSSMFCASYAKVKDLLSDMKLCYGLFPKWIDIAHPPESNMLRLAKHTYKILGERRSKVLAVVVKSECSSPHKSKFHVELEPVLNDNSSKQVYFWPEPPSESANQSAQDSSVVAVGPVSDKKSHQPVFRRLGILLTDAPCWIWKHFKFVSVIIPEAKPLSVFEYFSKHSSEAIHTVPCKIKDSVFKDVDSFKCFIKFITYDDLVTLKNSPGEDKTYLCRRFTSEPPPFGLPLLLTADGVLRALNEDDKVISSVFWEVFSFKLDKFLHPHLHELKLDPAYFLQASDKNWNLVQDIFASTLDESLACQRLKYGSAFININKVLKPLWKCLFKDPVIRKHSKDIVQKWALILSERDELLRYDPDHGHLMPVVPPRKPKRMVESNDTQECSPPTEMELEEEKDYHLFSKLFNAFKANRMPCVHKFVYRAHAICPTFSNPKSILTNLHHLYIEQGSFDNASYLHSGIYDQIPDLFSYFSRIDFLRDKESLMKIKNLPLFKCVDGKYRPLKDKVYFWPEHICEEGTDKLLQENVVFLDEESHWKELTLSNPSTLGLQEIDSMTLYVEYMFPHFHLLTEEERFCQLKHIRDIPELFQNAADCIKENYTRHTNTTLHSTEMNFLKGLEILPILMKDGQLACVSEFCDPRNAVFEYFPERYVTVPARFVEWLDFFSKIGLQKQPTPEDFEQLCHEVSVGIHSDIDIMGASGALPKCLFKVHEWHEDEDYLHRIGAIPFACVETVVGHSWIFQPSNSDVQVVYQDDGTQVWLTSLEKCADSKYAAVIWTVHPLVNIPDITFPPVAMFLNQKVANHREANFKKYLGLAKPSASHVIKNILNISQSRFSDFKLFKSYHKDCINKSECEFQLVSIMAKNFCYLDKELSGSSKKSCASGDVTKLQTVSCIPVNSNCKTGISISRPVLVKPLQVVRDLDEETFLHPYLCSLPGALTHCSPLLERIGVNPRPQLKNVVYALQLIKSHTTGTHIRKAVVESLLKLLYELLTFDKPGFDQMDTLYLPRHCDFELMKTMELIYNDLDPISYGGESFDFSSIPMSLLSNEYIEVRGYSFRLSDLLSKLPEHIHPKRLSTCCTEKFHSIHDVQEKVTPFACQLKRTLKLNDFMTVVKLVLHSKNPSSGQHSLNFFSILQSVVDCIEVVAISDLKVNLFYNGTSSIGTANVGFFLQIDSDRKCTLYVDTQPLLHRIQERIVSRITSEVLRRSDLSRATLMLEHVEEIMSVILTGGTTTDNLKRMLITMAVDPSEMKLQGDFDRVKSESVVDDITAQHRAGEKYPMIGGDIPLEDQHPIASIPKALVWIAQAEYDVQAMQVMYGAAKGPNEKLSGHVCFLAHQVVEKTLKAGMFATMGITDSSLHQHDLISLAQDLSQEIQSTALPELAKYFVQQDCYLGTRYPNRCGGQVPSKCYDLEDAAKAYEKSKEIFEIVHNSIT